ncbi:hypothetical protein QJQ45_023218, partial [Haematococcus lacustris]
QHRHGESKRPDRKQGHSDALPPGPVVHHREVEVVLVDESGPAQLTPTTRGAALVAAAADQQWGRVVLADELHTSHISSAVSGQQRCEGQLEHEQPTKPAGWKASAGQVYHEASSMTSQSRA